MRFKQKNIISVGVISNMDNELPTSNILSTLVEELGQAWASGFNIKSVLSNKTELFRLVLVCIG